MQVDKKILRIKKFVDEGINEVFSSEKRDILRVIAEYSIMGGKRFRPILFFITLDTLGKKYRQFLDIGVAIELIHNSGLIYDDLPCIDNDTFRRERFSTYKRFGEGPAILAGNWLLNYAFKLIANQKGISPEMKIHLVQEAQKWTGIMIKGQLEELTLRTQKRSFSKRVLHSIYKNKTASLFVLSVKMASVISSCSSREDKVLVDYATFLGFAFQLIDDLREYNQGVIKEGEFNYVVLYGLETTQKLIDRNIRLSLNVLDTLERQTENLREIIFFIERFCLL